MFITIKFGDDEQLLFNPDCSPKILLDNIKRRCHVPQKVEIDLLDEEGELKQLSQLLQNGLEHSCDPFTDRGVYYLIKLERKDSKIKFVSLLNNLAESSPHLAAKLEDMSCPRQSEPRPTSKDKWSRMAKKANKTTSVASSVKSKKQPRERDSSKASSRVK